MFGSSIKCTQLLQMLVQNWTSSLHLDVNYTHDFPIKCRKFVIAGRPHVTNLLSPCHSPHFLPDALFFLESCLKFAVKKFLDHGIYSWCVWLIGIEDSQCESPREDGGASLCVFTADTLFPALHTLIFLIVFIAIDYREAMHTKIWAIKLEYHHARSAAKEVTL